MVAWPLEEGNVEETVEATLTPQKACLNQDTGSIR